jgi:hypothetical protein
VRSRSLGRDGEGLGIRLNSRSGPILLPVAVLVKEQMYALHLAPAKDEMYVVHL